MSRTQETIEWYLNLVKDTIDNLDRTQIENAIAAYMEVYHNEGTIYIFGNGGSAASATHACGDFFKRSFFWPRKTFQGNEFG